jgi:hypothetical protein
MKLFTVRWQANSNELLQRWKKTATQLERRNLLNLLEISSMALGTAGNFEFELTLYITLSVEMTMSLALNDVRKPLEKEFTVLPPEGQIITSTEAETIIPSSIHEHMLIAVEKLAEERAR